MPTVFDADLILLANTATFDEGDDGNHTAVDIEAGTSYLIMVQVGASWTGDTPLLDVSIELSDDAGSNYREALVFPQITESIVETGGQVTFYGYVAAPMSVAGQTALKMRAVTDCQGTDANLGTVGIRAMGCDLPQNYPTGLVNRNIIPDVYQRFA